MKELQCGTNNAFEADFKQECEQAVENVLCINDSDTCRSNNDTSGHLRNFDGIPATGELGLCPILGKYTDKGSVTSVPETDEKDSPQCNVEVAPSNSSSSFSKPRFRRYKSQSNFPLSALRFDDSYLLEEDDPSCNGKTNPSDTTMPRHVYNKSKTLPDWLVPRKATITECVADDMNKPITDDMKMLSGQRRVTVHGSGQHDTSVGGGAHSSLRKHMFSSNKDSTVLLSDDMKAFSTSSSQGVQPSRRGRGEGSTLTHSVRDYYDNIPSFAPRDQLFLSAASVGNSQFPIMNSSRLFSTICETTHSSPDANVVPSSPDNRGETRNTLYANTKSFSVMDLKPADEKSLTLTERNNRSYSGQGASVHTIIPGGKTVADDRNATKFSRHLSKRT